MDPLAPQVCLQLSVRFPTHFLHCPVRFCEHFVVQHKHSRTCMVRSTLMAFWALLLGSTAHWIQNIHVYLLDCILVLCCTRLHCTYAQRTGPTNYTRDRNFHDIWCDDVVQVLDISMGKRYFLFIMGELELPRWSWLVWVSMFCVGATGGRALYVWCVGICSPRVLQ